MRNYHGNIVINQSVSFELPTPWVGKSFKANHFGPINFLVGPNGSGKSRFAEVLRRHLPNSRLLGTDRLQGTGIPQFLGMYGDNFAEGLQKNHFPQLKTAGITGGSGIDAFILLENGTMSVS